MKRQKKKYSRPQRPFDKARIEEENVLREKYGLKNKKEIWKADAAIGRIRNLAKQLITASDEDRASFIERLQAKGFKVDDIADALALNKEDWLKRRLQTVLLSKGMTTTANQARQLIVHKHVSIGEQVVNIPSYMVTLEEEPIVKLDIVLKTNKPKSKEEEIKKEVLDGDEVGEESDESFAEETSEETPEDNEGENTGNSKKENLEEESGSEESQVEEKVEDPENPAAEEKIPEDLGDTKTDEVIEEKVEGVEAK